MANNVTNWVWENSRAENGALIVLLAIAREAGRDGNAAMSVRQIAVKTRLGERTVKAALIDLSGTGELEAPSKAAPGGVRALRVIMDSRAKSAHPAVQNLHTGPDGSEAQDPSSRAKSAHQGSHQPSSEARCAKSARHEPEAVPPSRAKSAHPGPVDQQVRGHLESGSAKSAPLKTSDMSFSTTGRSEVPAKDVSEVDRPDVGRLCHHLAERVTGNGSRRPDITRRWRDAARLMIDRDGHTEEQIHRAIDWSQDHEFWRANILSMPKLREKYDQLRLQASRPARAASTRQAETDAQFQRQMSRATRRMEARNDTPRNGDPDPVRARTLPAPGHG